MKIFASVLLAVSGALSPALAAPILGSAESFAVIGASAVNNTGNTFIFGDIAVAPGTALTGGASLTQTGAVYLGNSVALQAQSDALNAYNMQIAKPFTSDLSGQDLGGLTLHPGVYYFSHSAQLNGTLTLDAQGQAGATFIFQVGSALATASSSIVSVINGVADESIFFDIGSSATLGIGTQFAGNILASQAITLNTGVSILCGRAIALNAAVTLDANKISSDCAATSFGAQSSDFGSIGYSGVTTASLPTAVPEPSVISLISVGFAALGLVRMRRERRSLAVTHPSV